jgi:cation diffusion facilitator family transporter
MMVLSPGRALALSVAAALLTMALKTLAWWLTGSVGFLSDALESSINLAGAGFALLMVRWALEPADAGHPFGHGKAEYFSAAFEAGLITIAALAIIVAAGERLLNPRPLLPLGVATAVSVAASALNLWVARVLLASGRAHRSPALEADGRHLLTDVWTTGGVIVGVGLAWLSGWHWLDPLVAIAVAINILREGWRLMRQSVHGLMDQAIDDDELARVERVLGSFAARGARFDDLRTRQAGAQRFANVALQVPGNWSVTRAHDLADEIERAVANEVTGLRLETHIEPLPSAGPGAPPAEPANDPPGGRA